MNSMPLNTVTGTSTLIDAKRLEWPIPIIKLESAMKKTADGTVFAVMTTDALAEPNVRDFCTSSGHDYLGVERFDNHDIHYVKKHTLECQRCSKLRVVALGIAAVGALTYTAPQVIHSNPSGIVTVAFAVTMASLPPVLINNFRLIKQVFRKASAPRRAKAAD